MFLPNIMPRKHAVQDQIDALQLWLGKKLDFWRESRSLGRSLGLTGASSNTFS